MTNSKSHPVSDSASVRSLLETLNQVLPGLEKLLMACHDLLPDSGRSNQSSACNSCPDNKTCREPCDDIRTSLPKVNQGRGNHENLTGFHENTLIKTQERRHLDIFNEYEACKQIFTDKQWIVICLYYRDGKTQQEIAKELDKSISTINEHLKNAQKRQSEYDKKLRAEKLEYLKNISDDEP